MKLSDSKKRQSRRSNDLKQAKHLRKL